MNAGFEVPTFYADQTDIEMLESNVIQLVAQFDTKNTLEMQKYRS